MIANENISVTGAGGYIGSSLSNYLAKKGYKIVKISNKNIKSSFKYNLKLESSWRKILKNSDHIVHLSAATSLYDCEKNSLKTQKANVLPIKKLINAAKKMSSKPHVIYASTATIYGSVKVFPVNEKRKLNPSSEYDLQKLICENLLKKAARDGVLRSTILRFSNIYGPSLSRGNSTDRGILNKVIKSAIGGNDIEIFGSGNYIRDYIYIDDVLSAIESCLKFQNKSYEVFNVGTQKLNTLKKVFKSVKKFVYQSTNKSININYVPWPLDSHKIEKRNYVSDISKIKRELGWKPLIDIDSGIKKTINFFLKI